MKATTLGWRLALCLLFATCTLTLSAKSDTPDTTPKDGWFTTSDGVKLHYTVAGKGAPLVLLPGFGSSNDNYGEVIATMSRHYKVYCLDYRWHGKSEDPRWGYHLERFATDFKEFLEHAKLKKINLYCHSMGNAVAWSYFEIYGQKKVARYILGDEPVCLLKDPAWTDEELRSYSGTFGQYHPDIFLNNDIRKPQYQSVREEMLARLMHEHLARDWRDVLPLIKVPTMLVMGGNSFLGAPELWNWMHSQIKGSRLEVVYGGQGHNVQLEPQFETLVVDFLGK